ncbi:MAG TPA: tetratricopeptide repeat protein [Pirellulales bacterium]|nr:tetratricopeptide repeat protein [Pirellulales bacterium]
MTPTAEIIHRARGHHQAGQLDQAERLYRAALSANPRDAATRHLLGLVAFQQGRFEVAAHELSQAIRLDGAQPAFHANLGEVYRALGQLGDARACYEQALRIRPDMAEAHNNLGTLLQAQALLPQAVAAYRQALAAKPDYADAHNNLGTLFQQQGQYEAALACYRRAVEVDPKYARGYYNIGVVEQSLGRLEDAVRALEQAISCVDHYFDAHYGLAIVLQKLGRFEPALAAYRRALQLRPASAEAHCSLGSLLQAQDKLQEAIGCYEQALAICPNYADAHYNWGTALKALRQPELAVTRYQQAIACKGDFVDAHFNLGTVLQELAQLDAAVVAYCEAIRLCPTLALAHNNLGNILQLRGQTPEAIECYQAALRVDPERAESLSDLASAVEHAAPGGTGISLRGDVRGNARRANAYCNLATALEQQEKYDAALDCYAESLRLAPDFPEAHYNRALSHLSHERFAEGWADFAWRFNCRKYPQCDFAGPLWDGSLFPGRTLVVHAEQGFGDTFQFVRYLKLVRPLGGTVLFQLQKPLVPLLACSGIEGLVAGGEQPGADFHVPLLSLPGLLGTNRDTLPANVPYLAADGQLVDHWARRLAAYDEFKIGITWQGNREFVSDRTRSVPLHQFEPLARLGGVRLFALQKYDGRDQLSVARDWPLVDLGEELDEHHGAFMDTAAVMRNLDLVITSDTATAHLAGALGVPVWVAISTRPDWRWFRNRADSPWYPTMRVFRQASADDWSTVFKRLAADASALVERSLSVRPPGTKTQS